MASLNCKMQDDIFLFCTGNLTVKKLNETNFLVSAGIDEIYQILLQNKSLFIVQEPFPDIDFADFRDNELYIKV